MRLNTQEKNKLILYAKHYFGEDIHLYLFGSRVDDSKKGGDIDLFLETQESISLKTQLEFLVAIYKDITQRKIDLVIKNSESEDLPIYITAKKTGILLC